MPRIWIQVLTTTAIVTCLAAAAGAQTTATPNGEQPLLGSSITAETLAALPSGATVFSLLDTTIPEVITDRVDAGSLTPGEAARVGAHGSSWTQTLFRIGDVDITDPDGSGSPLVLPGVLVWERVDIATGAMGLDVNAPGLAITLVPRRPAASWTRQIDLFGAGPGLLSRTAGTNPPTIARLATWRAGNFLLSGPLVPGRLGIVVAATWTRATRFDRDFPTQLEGSLTSVFTHLVFTPTARDEVRTIVWGQGARAPYENRAAFGQPLAAERDTSIHVQSAWERRLAASEWSWALFGSFTARERTTDLQPSSAIVVERLRDGPVPALLVPIGTDRAWSAGVRLKAPSTLRDRGRLQAGVTVSGGSARVRQPFAGRIGELVDGLPARVWDYADPGVDSRWGELTLATYAGYTFAVRPRLTVDAGARVELINGSAAASQNDVAWRNWFPRAGLRWNFLDRPRIAAFARYSRYGHRLPLSDLAYGDASAPTANVFLWNATVDPQVRDVGPLVSRAGPGTGGDPQFSTINPRLNRPYMDEATFGFESHPNSQTLVRLSAIARRERQLIGVIDTGAPQSSYSVFFMTDPGTDHAGGQMLPVYNRLPATYGADRYLLTNLPDDQTTFVGVEISAQVTASHWFVVVGGTAGRSEGLSANRGFRAVENDQGVVGELFTDPNARTYAKGRLFTERGYTIKTAGVYRFPHDVRLGITARYQDGQHFARLVIVPGLNQGVEMIRAFANGRTRFTYTLTVDARLQKDFAIGKHRLTGLIEGYNLLNTATEIEEFPVTGPSSRLTAAVQPPRSVRIGIIVPF